MKVKYLIEELSKLDSELEVGLNHEGYLDRYVNLYSMYVDGNYIPYNAYPNLENSSLNEEFVKVVIIGGSLK